MKWRNGSRRHGRLHARKAAWLVPLVTCLGTLTAPALAQVENPSPTQIAGPTIENRESTASLEYIMVFGPEDREDEWKPRYRPVPPGEFRELLRRAHRGQPPSIRSAKYEARFSEEGLVDGRALLEIEHTGPTETTLPLSPCNLAIGRAGWADRDGEAARMGLGPKGLLELRVDHSGWLDFDWSLRGTPGTRGSVDFDIGLPPCPASQLQLTLPADRIPVLHGGIVTGGRASAQQRTSTETKEGEQKDRLWEIELGGTNRLSLRIAPEDDPDGHSQFTELREQLTYSLDPGGLELTAQLRFDVLDQPLDHLELLLPSTLSLVALRDGDRSLSWSERRVRGRPYKQIVFDPELPRSTGRELTLKALAPIQLDDPWRLPRIEVLGVNWCETVATISALHPLRLEDATSDNGRLASVGEHLARSTTDTIFMELFSADAQMTVVLCEKPTPPRVDYGVSVEMSGGQLTARQVLLLEADEGEFFKVVGDLNRSWRIDSVQSDPPGRVSDRRTDLGERGKRQLVVDLDQPLSNISPVKLIVSARRIESTAGIQYRTQDLVPVVPHSDYKLAAAMMALRASEPYRLVFSNDNDLTERTPEDLSAREAQLFAGGTYDKVYLRDGADKDLEVGVEKRRAMYSAKIDVAVTASGGQVTEEYGFQITPQTARIDEIVVETMSRPGTTLRWEPDGGVRPLANPGSGEKPEFERWAIRLRPGRDNVLRVRASRMFQLEDNTPIGLPRFPDAFHQTGVVSIAIQGGEPVYVENRSLTPEFWNSPDHPIAIPRFTYRYDPAQSLISGPPPLVLRRDESTARLPRAWVWLFRLESRLEPSGQGHHVATYRVESAGLPFLHLDLPASFDLGGLEAVEVDGHRAPLASFPDDPSEGLDVRLDTGKRFHEVAVRYQTSGVCWAALHSVEFSVPEPNIPVLRRDWAIWLPPDREIIETQGLFHLSEETGRWPTNILGPLAHNSSRGTIELLAARWNRSPRQPETANSSTDVTEPDTDFPADWGDLVVRAESIGLWSDLLHQDEEGVLLVDTRAVAERGITPRTSLALPEDVSPERQTARLLDRQGLAIAVTPKYLILTSANRAAAHGQRLNRVGAGILWQATDPQWIAEIEQCVSEPSPDLVMAKEWSSLPLRIDSPWSNGQRPGFEPGDTIGWTLYQKPLADSAEVEVMIIDRNLRLSCLWLWFVLVALVSWAIGLRGPALSGLAVLAFCLAAAYLPAFWSPWLSAGFWGGIVGLLLRLVFVRRSRRAVRVVSTRRLGDSAAVVGPVAGCLLALLTTANLGAQPAEVKDWPDGPALIFAPVDKDRNPTGANYYVPEAFYMELHRRPQRIAEQAPPWLLKEADYRAQLDWQAMGKPLTVTEFIAEFEIEVVRPNVPVEIPLGDTLSNWRTEAAWLDGRSRSVRETEGKIVFTTDPVKSCQLRLQLTPTPGFGVYDSGFHLTIPPLATSRLELAVPADAMGVEIPTATGRSLIRPGQSKIAVDLGPTDTLAVRWHPTGRDGTGKTPQVDELIWLRVAVGGASMEAQFQIDRGDAFDGNLEVVSDPRLDQPDTYTVDGQAVDTVEDVSRSPSEVRQKLSIRDAGTDKVIVRSEYVFRDASGVGSLPLPKLHTSGCKVSHRWVAITADPRLQYDVIPRGQASQIGVSLFTDAWSGETDLPLIAYELKDQEASLELKTHPKPAQSTAQWQMRVAYGLNETQYRYRADIMTSEGYLFRHRLQVPPSLLIDEVSAFAGDLPQSIRWTRPSPKEVVVFFDTAVRDLYSIQLRGHLRAKGPREEPLHQIIIEDVESETGTIDIYRQHEAIVELASVEGLIEQGPPVGTVSEHGLGRGVTRWVVDGVTPMRATARIERNVPKIVVREQIISLRQTPEGWAADVDCRLEVQDGIADRIRLRTGELWPGPYTVSSGLAYQVNKGGNELTLLPPVRNELTFQISGPIVPKAGGSISVPRIRFLNADYTDESQRLVVLPSGPAPSIRWHVLGLTSADLPTRFVARMPGISWNAYRVQQEDFLATLHPRPEQAQVHLADIRVTWNENGQCRGVAMYDLEVGETQSCVLRLPHGWRLVAASIHGVPISPQYQNDDSWILPIGKTYLPQRLELVYTGRTSPDHRGATSLEVFPELRNLPVRRVICSIAGPGEFAMPGAGDPAARQRVAIARLQNVTALIHRAAANTSKSAAGDTAWYRAWFAEWTDARRQAEVAVKIAERESLAGAERAELEALDGEFNAIAEPLGIAPGQPRTDLDVVWADSQSDCVPKYYMSKDGSLPGVVQIDFSGPKQDVRAALAPVFYVSLALLVVLIAWATGRLYRWPHLFGVALGLCWWLWVWPSIVGLLIIAVCLQAALRSPWRRPRSSGSAIVRLSTR